MSQRRSADQDPAFDDAGTARGRRPRVRISYSRSSRVSRRRPSGEAISNQFPKFQVMLTSELEELYMQGVPALNVFLNVVVAVAGGISALIILLTMYTTVTERTRQIGVLKSLGMSKTKIAITILQEALLITFAGVIFGVVGTFVLKFLLSKWTTLQVEVDPQLVFNILIVGLVSGTIGALYPGLRAARLDAVDALNYE
jgi:putative ABC transport system permease protein